jgi:hypothetical protein
MPSMFNTGESYPDRDRDGLGSPDPLGPCSPPCHPGAPRLARYLQLRRPQSIRAREAGPSRCRGPSETAFPPTFSCESRVRSGTGDRPQAGHRYPAILPRNNGERVCNSRVKKSPSNRVEQQILMICFRQSFDSAGSLTKRLETRPCESNGIPLRRWVLLPRRRVSSSCGAIDPTDDAGSFFRLSAKKPGTRRIRLHSRPAGKW